MWNYLSRQYMSRTDKTIIPYIFILFIIDYIFLDIKLMYKIAVDIQKVFVQIPFVGNRLLFKAATFIIIHF